ncbi:hypothetical protein CEP52_015636 [Fusarium oligoseptatum]|uniref:Developmental regulatory protein wetA n=1 Tax=Fusarium oligoseptatum TaxID=2604345 RepID=A0A428SB83_9HYPO|nr:hypothetical protein CEP52_015636 [Fusarium oligoseptatum]
MASWTLPYRVEAVDREPGFYWQDLDDGPNDGSNDFFGQFINFDTDIPSSMADPHGPDPAVPTLPGSIIDHHAESTASSGVSTTEDEFDFFSCSSQVDATMPSQPSSTTAPALSHEIDPRSLALASSDDFTTDRPSQVPRVSMSDPALPRVEGISLQGSPVKREPASQPSSPTPPNTNVRKPNKFVEALSSTIRKAGKLRKTKKPIVMDRSASPTMDNPPRALRLQHHEYGNGNDAFPPSPTGRPDNAHFVHGILDDPFNEIPAPPPADSLRFFSNNGLHTPVESPGIKPEHGNFPPEIGRTSTSSGLATPPATTSPPTPAPTAASSGALAPCRRDGIRARVMGGTRNGEYIVVDPQQQKNANLNLAMHAQHAELPYEYQVHDPNAPGLMIHMPQPRAAPAAVHDLTLNAQTYLPPPPPIPLTNATSERHRPPRAPSSGARHLSCSPIRKTRQPSASPTPATAHSRHSSNGSVTSARSASGRGIVPGTPTAMRKQRRSREPSGGSVGGGGEIGFVNFTPNDGSILMTGVAPSGSSKTKARREREAMERRRRLSEAAMKAVQAAGGDVDKLMEQGFAF